MTEYHHDHPGDEHHELPPPDADPAGDHGDSYGDHHEPLPTADDLGAGHEPPAPELHFPGDEVGHDVPAAELDPSAPWPDDSDFTQWLGGHDAGAPDAPADGDGLADSMAAPPDATGGLPTADELVDWTLRHLAEEG